MALECAVHNRPSLLSSSRPIKHGLTPSRMFSSSVVNPTVYLPQVLATKDWTKWDWDVVDDIVQDILPHPPRLVDALRTKWIKRVSGFYRFVGASGTSIER